MIKKKEELEIQNTNGVFDEMHPTQVEKKEETKTKEDDDAD